MCVYPIWVINGALLRLFADLDPTVYQITPPTPPDKIKKFIYTVRPEGPSLGCEQREHPDSTIPRGPKERAEDATCERSEHPRRFFLKKISQKNFQIFLEKNGVLKYSIFFSFNKAHIFLNFRDFQGAQIRIEGFSSDGTGQKNPSRDGTGMEN